MELIDTIFVSSILSLLFITLLNIVDLNHQIILFLILFVILLFKTFLEDNKNVKELIINTIKQNQMNTMKQNQLNTMKQNQMNTMKQNQLNTMKQSKNMVFNSNNKNFLNLIKIKKTKPKKLNKPKKITISKEQQCYIPLKMKDNLTLSKINEHNDYIRNDCIEDGTCLI